MMATIGTAKQGREWVEARRAQRRREGRMLDYEALDEIAARFRGERATKVTPHEALEEVRGLIASTGREVS